MNKMAMKRGQMSLSIIKYVRNSLILIVYRISWKCNEFNEEMCKKIVGNVVQVIQSFLQIFVVFGVEMYYNERIREYKFPENGDKNHEN